MEEKKKLFGKGIYGSKDVPIKLLDGFIAVALVLIVILTIWFATKGGFWITYDTDGGSEVASVQSAYGKMLEEPQVPVKPGYTFSHWVTSLDESIAVEWNFGQDVVEDDMTLYAVWELAQILVKFHADGGSMEDDQREKMVLYGESYGELPMPMKEGATFQGWVYSGALIEPDTIVQMTGEHVLTAIWSE